MYIYKKGDYMSKAPIIQVDDISKCYRLGVKGKERDSICMAAVDFIRNPMKNYKLYRSLYNFSDADFGRKENREDILWALRDVSFRVTEGEVLGVVGANGAGKSTLLKVLSRVTSPTCGKAEIRGRLSSLLEVGTGFHPELTGRENVYLNGTVLGMSKTEVERKFDEIVDFSGIEQFIDTPVKRYSSGMKLRLAFSVAAFLEPEVMVVDEVLAVGDLEFQRKCLKRMKEYAGGGRTVLFVSHNMKAIKSLCSKAIFLDDGAIACEGSVDQAVNRYMQMEFRPVDNMRLEKSLDRKGDGRLVFSSVHLRDASGRMISKPAEGEDLELVFNYRCSSSVQQMNFRFHIYNQDGVTVSQCNYEVGGKRADLSSGEGQVSCKIPELPLPAGLYKIALLAYDDNCLLDRLSAAIVFEVTKGNFFERGHAPSVHDSTCLLEHSWEGMAETVYEQKTLKRDEVFTDIELFAV